MTNEKKIEFRKLLVEYLVLVAANDSQGDVLTAVERIEKWVDGYLESELAKIIGRNSTLRVTN